MEIIEECDENEWSENSNGAITVQLKIMNETLKKILKILEERK